MQRHWAVLLVCLFMATTTAVHAWLVGYPPGYKQLTGGLAQRVEATGESGDPRALPTSAPGQGVDLAGRASSSLATYTFSSEGEIEDRRGTWLTDQARGRLARIDRGPIPVDSALLPILMYHNVRPIDFKTTNAFVSDLTLPPSEFEQQLRYLLEKGFKSATMDDLELHLQGRKELPARSVILTFDDGFENNYLYAFPLLRKYGFTGTFFVVTGFVDKPEYMTWPEVQALVAGGMQIGGHTVSHLDLGTMTPAQRERELVQGKKTLEEMLRVSVRALSYPGGSYNLEVVAAARQAGYALAVTTQYGAVHSRSKPFELSRIRIHGKESLGSFRWRIEQYFPNSGPSTS